MSDISAERRNHMITSHRKDELLDWIKELLYHSFVLGNKKDSYLETMGYIEALVDEHRTMGGVGSRLKTLVPSVSHFHTKLHLKEAFDMYDEKYAVTQRRHLAPTFNEIRHILNLSQLIAIGTELKFVSFDGDQTLYSDGGNFEEKSGLSYQIIELLKAGIIVCVITAANYQHDGSKYEVRLAGLLRRFIKANLSAEEIERFHIMGGECNFLLQCKMIKLSEEERTGAYEHKASLVPVMHEVWQADHYAAPKPYKWEKDKVIAFLDAAEESFRQSKADLRLRTRIIRKPTSVGMIPGGEAMVGEVPNGHGSLKIKAEALDEVVLRALDNIQNLPAELKQLHYCAFNGGRDCWVDVGTKGVAVEALQAYFDIPKHGCLHVGDQFLQTGNDISARDTCATIWITSPKETFKILDHLLRFSLGMDKVERAAAAAKADDLDNQSQSDATSPRNAPPSPPRMDVYTGELQLPSKDNKAPR